MKVVPQVRAIWAVGLIWLTIVSVLVDFAVNPASANCFAHQGDKCLCTMCVQLPIVQNCKTLGLCCALLCCTASFRPISAHISNLMMQTSKLVIQSRTSLIRVVTCLEISSHAATPCWPPITNNAPTENNSMANDTGQAQQPVTSIELLRRP